MNSYPITISGEKYCASHLWFQENPNEYQRIGKKIEEYINNDMAIRQNNTTRRYISFFAASKIDEKPKIVRDIIFSIDYGHNGITIYKGDYELALQG